MIGYGGRVSLRIAGFTLGAICLVYAAAMALNALQMMAIDRQIMTENGDGIGGDGEGIYKPIDAHLWNMGLLIGSALLAVSLIAWLRRRNSN
jgi:hypothetical protein